MAQPIKKSAIVHSDSELSQKMEPVGSIPDNPSSNEELAANSYGTSPVLDGNLHPPERANVNAMREALETQVEMETGKTIKEKEQELKLEPEPQPAQYGEVKPQPEKPDQEKPVEIEAEHGKQIIINIAAALQIFFSGKMHPAKDYADASRQFTEWRDAEGLGASDMKARDGGVYSGAKLVAKVSYNGRVWMPDNKTEIPLKQSAEGIGGEDQGKITSGHAGGMSGGTDLQGPLFHVGFLLRGKTRSAAFKTRAAADAFVKGAAAKFGKDFTIKRAVENYHGDLSHLPGHDKSMLKLDKCQACAEEKHDQCRMNGTAPYGKKERCTCGCHWSKPLKSMGDKDVVLAAAKTADYEGWTNWTTWHVNLLIDNTQHTYESKRRLAANAVRKGIGLDQLAGQFSRLFNAQFKETKKFYEANSTDARESRGAWERKKLEGEQPNKDYVDDTEKQEYLKHVVDDLFYGIGGQSSWEEPMEECNWREIAQHAMDNEREEGVQEAENPQPFTGDDQKFLESLKIRGSKQEKEAGENMAIKTAAKPMPQKGSPEWHRLKIAIKTLQMPDAIAGVMGGPSKEEARQTVTEYGINPTKYESAEETQCETCGQPGPTKVCDKCRTHFTTPKQGGEGAVKTEGELEKEAGFNFFFPGQVLKEFYPEIQHEIVDYPNASNAPMGAHAPEMVGDGGHDMEAILDEALGSTSVVESIMLPGDVSDPEPMAMAAADYSSTSPAGAMGIGRDGKSQVLEGVPLRKENDIRGPMFTDEFYGQNQAVPGKTLTMAGKLASSSSASLWKEAAGSEDEVTQFGMFLKRVCGEIAAALIFGFKATTRPLLNKVPGIGEVQLAQVEQPQQNPAFMNAVSNTNSRVKYLMDKLNDSEVQDAINTSWAQAAVWNDSPKGGYVYEVFVRAETIDTDSMIMRYKFVVGTKE